MIEFLFFLGLAIWMIISEKIKEEKFIRDHKEESQKRIDDFNAYWEKMEELRKKLQRNYYDYN
mgnify:CR=1 FL=1